MKIQITGVNTNNHDHLGDCLGVAGLKYCEQSIDIDGELYAYLIDCDNYEMYCTYSEFEQMIDSLIDNGFKVELIK